MVIVWRTCTASAQQYFTLQDFLQSYFNVVLQDQTIPDSYTYIDVKYKNSTNTHFATLLQKVIYLWYFPNIPTYLPLKSYITQRQVADIIKSNIHKEIAYQDDGYVSSQRLVSVLSQVQECMQQKKQNISQWNSQALNYNLLESVYSILHEDYIDKNSIDSQELLYGATQWLVKSLNDEHTVFMPPPQATNFTDEMQWNFEGIGAYIESKQQGIIHIVAPIQGSPADLAWLLPGDQILMVDEHKVTKDTQVNQVIDRIKWPRGTLVIIKYLRNKKEYNVSIQRDTVVIKNIESKVYTWGTCYINIRMFDFWVYQDFSSTIDSIWHSSTCNTYIFDVRNNPGGSLDEVQQMLNYIVPTKSPSIIIKGNDYNETLFSQDIPGKKITETNSIILTNKGSASASEIFAGVAKEYGNHVKIIGEPTFGKWSVQTMVEYSDGSVLKYTIAKWYTGKYQKNIDKIWLFPDITIYDDVNTSADEQLDYARSYIFK